MISTSHTGPSFTPTLKTVKADERGRLSLGAIYPATKGAHFQVAIDHKGRILLTPAESTNHTTGVRVDGR